MGFFFDIKTEIDIDHREPDSFLWLYLFRIYKEALTNVMKHLKAKTVYVDLTVAREGLFLSVYDDGVGIGSGKSAGRGIANMKTRAKEIGGKVKIISGKGTTVSLELPLNLRFSVSRFH
jgi:two-component system sensor histidine kinase UhpB